jgi:hypothetical protein
MNRSSCGKSPTNSGASPPTIRESKTSRRAKAWRCIRGQGQRQRAYQMDKWLMFSRKVNRAFSNSA